MRTTLMAYDWCVHCRLSYEYSWCSAPDASQCTGERKRTRRAQKQNIQLIWNCVDKSFTLVPEQRTFSMGAERKFKFPNASMSPLSTILRFRSRTTPYSVCYSSGHGSISVRDISFFWLPAFGKRHTSKKVSHSFTRAQQCTHIIMFDRFILVLTFRVRCRRVFSLRSFHVHLNALEIRMHFFPPRSCRSWAECAMTPLIYFIEMACVQRALHQKHSTSQ